MKTKQLIIPILLLTLSACKKELTPGGTANAVRKAKTGLNARSLADSTASDQYKISNITSTYTPAGFTLSHLEQATYTYGPDGKLTGIAVATTTRTKRPRTPISSPVIFDTVTVTTNVNHNYTYRANTVTIKYLPFNDNEYWENTFVLDNLGRVTLDTIRISNTPGSVSIIPRVYSYATVNSVAKTISITEPQSFITRYNLTNDNLSSAMQGVNTPQELTASYGFYTDKSSQPADALSLNQQLSPYGYTSISSKNLSQSASASTNPVYIPEFGVSYGIDGGAYAGCVDVKFAYEFDSAGRVVKITETGRTSSTTPYNILRTRVITYVNN